MFFLSLIKTYCYADEMRQHVGKGRGNGFRQQQHQAIATMKSNSAVMQTFTPFKFAAQGSPLTGADEKTEAEA